MELRTCFDNKEKVLKIRDSRGLRGPVRDGLRKRFLICAIFKEKEV